MVDFVYYGLIVLWLIVLLGYIGFQIAWKLGKIKINMK